MISKEEIKEKYGIDFDMEDFELFLKANNIEWVYSGFFSSTQSIEKSVVDKYVKYKETINREDAKKREALSKILISSGFSFDGYKIVKYSGYISGDGVAQVDRGYDYFVGGTADVGAALTDSLVKIRREAIQELKEAAYDLGCNAVIGLDFDYITLQPETANLHGGTTYQPYVFCVTANGNAVIIEKEDAEKGEK